MMRKLLLILAIIAYLLAAAITCIWLIGGELLWIRVIMFLPIPAEWKGVLFGWI